MPRRPHPEPADYPRGMVPGETLKAGSCDGMQRHDRATANMIARRSKKPRGTFRYPYCRHWHIGDKK